MAGKSKTPEQRRAMRERCEKIAAKYRECDENTTGWSLERAPDYSKSLPPDMQRKAQEAAGQAKRCSPTGEDNPEDK